MKEELSMGYLTKIQVIERAKGQRQFYLICPAPLAQALEMEKGETIEWVVEDKWTLRIRRGEAQSAQAVRRSHGKR
jgi:hypothetical protein